MVMKLKKWYVNFLEQDKRNFWGTFFYYFLYFLSFIYGSVVGIRNFFYDKKIIPSYSCQAKVISVGNLSWSGSGKTSLCNLLYLKFSLRNKVAILRRGYGRDEEKLLKEQCENVFSLPDRLRLAKKNETLFDIFILDDGFSYRRLKRDVDIVVMGAREFKANYRLIPAYFFREPLRALRRADIVVLNYADEIEEPLKVKASILKIAPYLKVYFSRYKIKNFSDLKGNRFDINLLKGKKIAALTAIGYPQGFFNKLKELDLEIASKIVYPDHYELSEDEFKNLQDSLQAVGISDLIITSKDKYHLPFKNKKVKFNIIVMEVEIEIEDVDRFIKEIEAKLAS